MSKTVKLELSAQQARDFVWVLNIFESTFDGYDEDDDSGLYRDGMKAVDSFAPMYDLCNEFAIANGK